MWGPFAHSAGVPRLTDLAADLLLGGRCPGCDRPGHGLCPDCAVVLGSGRVHFAGRDPSPPGFPPTVAAGVYAGVVKRLIARYKDERLLGLTGPLATRLAWSLVHLLAAIGQPGEAYRIVPVPSRPAAVRERGLDHTHTLAVRAAKRLRHLSGLRLPVVRGLSAVGPSADQAGLDAATRLVNRAGRFRATAMDPGTGVILIDDVTTTGATLAAAATALRQGGISVLGAAVVAATVRRRAPAGP